MVDDPMDAEPAVSIRCGPHEPVPADLTRCLLGWARGSRTCTGPNVRDTNPRGFTRTDIPSRDINMVIIGLQVFLHDLHRLECH
jgi:hypothetical protein